MAGNAPRKKRGWFRRLLNVALLITAVAMWMNLHHINPWAYISAPSEVAPLAESKLNHRINGRFQADSLQKLINDIERKFRVRVEMGPEPEKQLTKGGSGPVDFHVNDATVRSLLITAIDTLGQYRFETRGDVLEVSNALSPLSTVTEVHPVMGGWAANEVKGQDLSGNGQFTSLSPNAFVFPQANWSQGNWLGLNFRRRGLPASPWWLATSFSGPKSPTLHAGLSIYSEAPESHDLFRKLDEQLAGGMQHGPKQLTRLDSASDDKLDAAMRARVELSAESERAEDVIRKLLDDTVPFILHSDSSGGPVTLTLKDVQRVDALQLVLRQGRLNASYVDGAIVISNARYERSGNHRARAFAFVGDLIESRRPLPGVLTQTSWVSRHNSQLMVHGGRRDLRFFTDLISAGREAKKLSSAGEIVFVGDKQTRRIQRIMLEPAKSLGDVKTAGELAEAIRQQYGVNVVIRSAHESKQLSSASTAASSKPLYRLLRALLPKGESGRFSVEHGALLLEFGGSDNSQPPEYWIRTGRIYDPNFRTLVARLFGNLGGDQWPSTVIHHRASQIAYVRSDRDDLVRLKTALQLMDGQPTESKELIKNTFARKFAVPEGFIPLEEVPLREVLTPPTKYRHRMFHTCLAHDGVFVMGNAEELEKIQELLERWVNIEIDDPLADFANDDWLTRHKATLTAISQLRVDPSEERMRRYAQPFLSGESLTSRQRRLFVELISQLGANSPNLAPMYIKPFAESEDTDFRHLIIDLMFQLGTPALGELHQLTRLMNDDELGYLATKLAGLGGAVAEKDWWPLIMRVYDKHPPSHSQLRPILERFGEPQRTPGTLPAFPSINSIRTPNGR